MLPFHLRPLCLLVLVGLTTACAPTYQLSLKPTQSTNLFLEGREQARVFSTDSVEVRLSFVCFEVSRMVFEAVYRNHTKAPLVVAPAEFGYLPTRIWSAAPAPDAVRKRPEAGAQVTAMVAAPAGYPLPPIPVKPVGAFDPEPEISSLRATAEREAIRASRIDWFGAVLAITSLATDVAAIGKKETPAQAQSRASLHDDVVAYQVVSTANKVQHAIAAEQLQAQAAQLEGFALRKVTLEPGQQVKGLLYFPRFDTADAVRVLAPVPGGVLPMEFIQTHTRQ